MASGDILGITGDPLTGLWAVLILIGLSTVVKVAGAIKAGDFSMDELSGFLVPGSIYLGVLSIWAAVVSNVSVSAGFDTTVASFYYAGVVAVSAKYLSKLVDGTKDLWT